MRFKLLAASAAFFFATAAYAQNAGTVTSNAFAIGRGAGKTGFASVLCTQAQIAVGQNAAAPICRTLTGDVTIDSAGVTAIGANKVTNSQLATAADGTIKSNISGGTAAPSDNTISAVLDKLLGTARGSIAHRGASAWAALTPGTSGFFLKSNGPGADLSYVTATGAGTVTSAQTSAGSGIAVSGTCTITTTGNCSVALAQTEATLQGAPSNPAATSSATGVMLGLGVTTCRITTTYATRLDVSIDGNYLFSNPGSTNQFQLRYGTGAGPANAASATGTAVGAGPTYGNAPITQQSVSLRRIITGLSPATTYWLDLSVVTGGGGTTTVANVNCAAREF